jgi:hypothetical protein
MMTERAHERLDAYKASIDFLAIADEVSGSLPKAAPTSPISYGAPLPPSP